MEKLSYVYMMGSTSRRALYTGITAAFLCVFGSTRTIRADISRGNINAIVWFTLSNSLMWKRRLPEKKKSRAGAEKEEQACRVHKCRLERSSRRLVSKRTHERRSSNQPERIKHKVPQGYSPAEDCAGSFTPFGMTNLKALLSMPAAIRFPSRFVQQM